MTINERIKEVIRASKKSVKKFSEEIGIPKGTIDGIVSTRKSVPSFTILEAILKNDKKLNATWLMLGEGEMWINIKIEATENNEIDELKDKMIELENELTKIKVNQFDLMSESYRNKKNGIFIYYKVLAAYKALEFSSIDKTEDSLDIATNLLKDASKGLKSITKESGIETRDLLDNRKKLENLLSDVINNEDSIIKDLGFRIIGDFKNMRI